MLVENENGMLVDNQNGKLLILGNKTKIIEQIKISKEINLPFIAEYCNFTIDKKEQRNLDNYCQFLESFFSLYLNSGLNNRMPFNQYLTMMVGKGNDSTQEITMNGGKYVYF